MKNVAFFIYGIGNLTGGGGAERFFADFFLKYQQHNATKFNLFYILDKTSHENLKAVGKLQTFNKIIYFKLFSNRFKNKLESIQLWYFIIRYNIKLIHLPLYNVSYIPLLKTLQQLPKIWRPKLVINISNCYVVPQLTNPQHPLHNAAKNTYYPLFNEVNVDAYFSWYENFKEYIENTSFKNKPFVVRSITSRFSDTDKFFPMDKQNIIVFASRLDEQKHPEWFINAVGLLKQQQEEVIKNWKFIVCGNGSLRSELIESCKKQGIDEIVEFKIEGELNKVVNHSKIFVSCQDFENFPSLSMAEAMASGNAIIARNVGQTYFFLEESKNGVFINPDNFSGLANALSHLLKSPETINRMGHYSENLMKTKHSFENFVPQIETFWNDVINEKS